MARRNRPNRRAPSKAANQGLPGVVLSPSSLETGWPSTPNLTNYDPVDRGRLFSNPPAIVAGHSKNSSTRTKMLVPYTLKFHQPERIAICVRRKQRKEVLFAKKKAGKRGQRKPRFNKWSKVRCT